MDRWMRDLSLLMQFAGLAWALTIGWLYSAVYALSVCLFWLYSTPVARWKGDPLLSLLAIGISTGTNSLLLGVMAAGSEWTLQLLFAAPGAAFIILSLYPVSQIYQLQSDRERGDMTFALKYGLAGVRRFFSFSFILGLVLISTALALEFRVLAGLFLILGGLVWVLLIIWIYGLEGKEEEYRIVMKIKFITSFSFTAFIVISILYIHTPDGIEWLNSLLF